MDCTRKLNDRLSPQKRDDPRKERPKPVRSVFTGRPKLNYSNRERVFKRKNNYPRIDSMRSFVFFPELSAVVARNVTRSMPYYHIVCICNSNNILIDICNSNYVFIIPLG